MDVETRLNALFLVGAHVVRNDVALRRFAIRTEKERSDQKGYMKGQESRLLTKACAAFFSSSQRCSVCDPRVIYHPSESWGGMRSGTRPDPRIESPS